MGTGFCFDTRHVGLYARGSLGEAYVFNQLRDLVDICSMRVEDADGRRLVKEMDSNGRSRERALQIRDEALGYLQRHSATGLRWVISSGNLVLRTDPTQAS